MDNSEPYFDPISDPGRLNSVLDEFLRTHGKTHSPGNLQRAPLLNDASAAFDVMATGEDRPLRRKLARVIGQLRMPTAAIASLPDNYGEALKSEKFAKDLDPQHPEIAFLPPDLFDSNGSWVQIGGSDGGLVAPMHVENMSGRSVFRVFIRCPGGRKATLSYLQTLNLYRTPWELKPAEIATRYPTHESVRWDPFQLNTETPQFPDGTIVALVRQMMVINDRFEPELTPITQAGAGSTSSSPMRGRCRCSAVTSGYVRARSRHTSESCRRRRSARRNRIARGRRVQAESEPAAV